MRAQARNLDEAMAHRVSDRNQKRKWVRDFRADSPKKEIGNGDVVLPVDARPNLTGDPF